MFRQRIVQKDATELCTNLLQAFASCLNQAVFEEPDVPESNNSRVSGTPASNRLDISPSRSLPRTPNHTVRSSNDDLDDEASYFVLPSLDQRVLITLSNMAYTRDHIVPRLVESCSRYGYPASEKILASVEASFSSLDEKLFEAFLENKVNPIIGGLEPGMYAGRYDYADSTPEPTGVRAFVIEALMAMIQVIEEVSNVNPLFVSKVMGKIVENLAEELARIMQCITHFSTNGALQARLDLTALSAALHSCKTEDSSSSFAEAFEAIPPLPDVNEAKKMDDLVVAFKTKARFQLLVFQNCDSASTSPARPASAQSKEIY